MATKRLSRAPLGRQIAEALRNDILLGRLSTGTRLVQHELCDLFGTSRIPVRDALNQLEFEGFIEVDETRRPTVAPVSRTDLEDIYFVEGLLHSTAGQRAVENDDPDLVQDLQELHERMCEAESAGEPERMADLNWRFHARLNAGANSPKLLAAIRAFSVNVPREFLIELPSWMERANAEHAKILEAVAAGDATHTKELLFQHVRDAGTALAPKFQ